MPISLAIYGYDSAVGKLLTEYLDHCKTEFANIVPLSPLDGEFDAVRIKGHNWLISSINDYHGEDTDIFLALCTPDETERLRPFLESLPCTVIDASGSMLGGEQSHIIIPKLNGHKIRHDRGVRFIGIANSLTTQLTLTLAPLHDEFEIRGVNSTALVSVSELGMVGTEGLAGEAIALFNGNTPDNSPFAVQQAFNLINQIGGLSEGSTMFERTIENQVEKILPDFAGKLSLYCIQVPIFYGHCIITHVKLGEQTSIDELQQCLAQCPHIKVCDDHEELITPVTHLQDEDKILISRLKMLRHSAREFSFMSFMDNARVGQALSCVEAIELIAERIENFA